jgi:hypothetical protein
MLLVPLLRAVLPAVSKGAKSGRAGFDCYRPDATGGPPASSGYDFVSWGFHPSLARAANNGER